MKKEVEPPSPEAMVQRFELLQDGRYPILLANDGSAHLLHTGCPWRFQMPGGPDVMRVLGLQVPLKPSPLSRPFVEEGFEMMGVRFDALLGMNLLGGFIWTIDHGTHTVLVATSAPEAEDIRWVPVDAEDGPPISHLDDGTRFILDTGANISYKIGPVPQTAKVIGETEDWSLMWGKITTALWESTVQIGGHRIPVRFGKLPPVADSRLAWMDTGWILGADLLRKFIVTLDIPKGRLGLKVRS